MADFTYTNVPVTLCGTEIYLQDTGAFLSGSEIVDVSRPWLTRAGKMARRGGDGSMAFDMTALSGKRTFVSYKGLTDPGYDTASKIKDANAKVIRNSMSISGGFCKASNLSTVVSAFKDSQVHWAKLRLILAKLNLDISRGKYEELGEEYYTELTKAGSVEISVPGGSITTGWFGEGGSLNIGVSMFGWAMSISATVVEDKFYTF